MSRSEYNQLLAAHIPVRVRLVLALAVALQTLLLYMDTPLLAWGLLVLSMIGYGGAAALFALRIPAPPHVSPAQIRDLTQLLARDMYRAAPIGGILSILGFFVARWALSVPGHPGIPLVLSLFLLVSLLLLQRTLAAVRLWASIFVQR